MKKPSLLDGDDIDCKSESSMSFHLPSTCKRKFRGNDSSGSSIEEKIPGIQTGTVDNCLLETNSKKPFPLVLADPWFWCRAYNGINSVVSASMMIDLAVLDFYFYTEWFKCKTGQHGAFYLDLRTSKDLQGLEEWKNSLMLKSSVPQVPVVFFLQCLDHWPLLVVFNYKKGMVLLLGRGNNVEEFVGHPNWNQWNGAKLWTEISATMGWLRIEHNPRVIEANWIPVSY